LSDRVLNVARTTRQYSLPGSVCAKMLGVALCCRDVYRLRFTINNRNLSPSTCS